MMNDPYSLSLLTGVGSRQFQMSLAESVSSGFMPEIGTLQEALSLT